jgi:hypothetical protein
MLFVSTKTEHSKFNFSIKQKKWAESGLPNSAHKTGIVLLSHTVAGTGIRCFLIAINAKNVALERFEN